MLIVVFVVCFSVQLSQDSGVLQQRLQDEQFSLLQCAVVEAEGIVLDAVAKVDDPLHVRCISTPGLSFLVLLLLILLNILISSYTLYISNLCLQII